MRLVQKGATLIGLWLSALFCLAGTRALSPETQTALQTMLDSYVQQTPGAVTTIPGYGAAVSTGSGRPVVIVGGYANPTLESIPMARLFNSGEPDYVDVQSAQKIRKDTLFEIGSVTKVFTSAAILRQKELGALQLNQRLDAWLPLIHRLPGANCTGGGGDCPDLKELLGMTSGIPNLDDSFCTPPALCNGPLPPANQAIMSKGNQFWQVWYTFDYLAEVQPNFPPGDHYEYSSTNYFLLGQILMQLDNYFNLEAGYKLVTDPLGLDGVYLGGYEPMIEERRALGWSSKGSPRTNSRAFVTGYFSGGGMLATAADTADWIYELMQPGRVLSEVSLKEMQTFTPIVPPLQMSKTTDCFVSTGYGLGLARYEVRLNGTVIEVLGHPGLTGGFVSMAGYLPDQNIGFALIINRRDTNTFFEMVCKTVQILVEQT